jgi:hypothetical protein
MGGVVERGVLTAPAEVWQLAVRRQEGAFLFGGGIPAEFLPSPVELGRTDLA